jgi:hypothetical protein
MNLGFGARVVGEPPMHSRCARLSEGAAKLHPEGSLLARTRGARSDKPN